MASPTVQSALQSRGVSVKAAYAVAEFDCADDAANPTIVMIPADLNKNGLVILYVWAINTEVYAGTEDQGIITLSDESNNSLATVTVTDAGSPADDFEEGSLDDHIEASGGDAFGARMVAAGEYVDAVVTQQTTGTATGRSLLIVEYLAIPE